MISPPFAPQSRLLFIGDSITDAFRRPDELNPAFQLGNGFVFLLAARLKCDFPSQGWQFWNRGVSGNGLGDLAARWATDCLHLRPDWLSILVGVNETLRHFGGEKTLSTDEFRALYRRLLEQSRAQNPDLKLVLCEPFVLPCGLTGSGWREHLQGRAQVVRELATQFNAHFVPFQDAFDAACQTAPPEFWAYDGVHPTDAGFELMAREWVRVVGA